MPRRATVDLRRTPTRILGHMRRHLHRTQFVDEILSVIGFVSAQGNRLTPIRPRLDHVKRSDPLAVSLGLRKAGVNHQAVPVLHQGARHEAELGLLALAFAIEPRFGIGR
jgi:hypothetical protein